LGLLDCRNNCNCKTLWYYHFRSHVPSPPAVQRRLLSLLLLRFRLLRLSLLSSDSLSLLLLSLLLLLLLLLLLSLSLLLLPLPLSLLLLPPRAALRAASSAALRSAMRRGICTHRQVKEIQHAVIQ
jgi:hypothetical protein